MLKIENFQLLILTISIARLPKQTDGGKNDYDGTCMQIVPDCKTKCRVR